MSDTHHHDRHGLVPERDPGAGAVATILDPVCGMKVDPAKTTHTAIHASYPYYFCSEGCRAKFVGDPGRYLNREARVMPPPTAPAGVIYTCPMHPQIRQVGPGTCPICGMTLEPVAVTAEAPPNRELADMTRRFWIGLALTAPVFLLEMGGHIPALGLHRFASPRTATWIELALSTPVVLWAGLPFFQRGWASVVNRSLNMFSLIALGTGAAYVYSLVATFAPGLFPAGFRGMGGAVAVYFEAAAVITVLVLLGQVLELRAREADRRGLASPPQPRAQDRAPRPGRRRGRGSGAGHGPGRRPAARAAGRGRARGRRGRRGASAPSTNPWSPANPCPWPRRPATG